jgi:hypothetical protein
MLTHPDYLTTPHHLDLYRAFLEETQSIPGCWHALPNQVATWWRNREDSTAIRQPTGEWSIRGPVAVTGSVAKIEISDGDFSLTPAPSRNTMATETESLSKQTMTS